MSQGRIVSIDRRTTKVADIFEQVRAAIEPGEYPPGPRPQFRWTFGRRSGMGRKAAERGLSLNRHPCNVPGQSVCIPVKLVIAMRRAAVGLRRPVIVYGRTERGIAPLLRTDERHRDPNEPVLITVAELDHALLRRDLDHGDRLTERDALAIAIEFSSIATSRMRRVLGDGGRR